MMALDLILVILIRALPVIAWIVAVVLGVVMLKRRGGKAERFLIAGASLMLVSSVISASTDFIIMRLSDTQLSPGSVMARVLWGKSLIGLAGYVCLIYAFWIKFKVTAHA